VNAICPGYVDTELVRNQLGDLARTRQVPLERSWKRASTRSSPMRKLLQVSDVAEYALFLASDKAGGVTGQAVVVDAGYTAQ
jgi:3-hydroxybutyrate dehydrogenase